MDTIQPIEKSNEVEQDGLSANEFDLTYIDKRDRGLSPGVQNKDVQKHQHVDPQDPGLPRSPEVINKRPEEKKEEVVTEEDKTKLAEAENTEAANKAKEDADKAAEEAAKKATEEENKTLVEQAEYVSYGDPAADAAVELLKSKNIDPKESAKWFAKVLETNNPNDIDLSAMEAKLGKQDAQLVYTAVKDFMTRQTQTIQTTAKVVTEVFGGENELARVRNWVNTIDAKSEIAPQLAEYMKMLNAGEHSARIAAKAIAELYDKDPNNKSLAIKRVEGDGTPPKSSPSILSRNEYHAEMKKAQAEGNQARILELRNNRAQAHKK